MTKISLNSRTIIKDVDIKKPEFEIRNIEEEVSEDKSNNKEKKRDCEEE